MLNILVTLMTSTFYNFLKFSFTCFVIKPLKPPTYSYTHVNFTEPTCWPSKRYVNKFSIVYTFLGEIPLSISIYIRANIKAMTIYDAFLIGSHYMHRLMRILLAAIFFYLLWDNISIPAIWLNKENIFWNINKSNYQ